MHTFRRGIGTSLGVQDTDRAVRAPNRNRSLLASLGFADRDKVNPLHDQACDYICQQEQANVVARAGFEGVDDSLTEELEFRESANGARKMNYWPDREVLLKKTSKPGAAIVGFLDCLFTICGYVKENPAKNWEHTKTALCIAEVKIEPVPIGDVIRQLHLYKEFIASISRYETVNYYGERFTHHHPCYFTLVAPWRLDAANLELLEKEKITYVRLGESFREYVAERKRSPRPEYDEI